MSLKVKLVLLVAFCVVLPLLVVTFMTTRITSRLLQSELENNALKILTQTNNLVQNKIDPIFSYGFLAISNPVLPLAVRNGNRAILANVSQSIKKGLNLDIVEVLDGFGRVIYSENQGEVGLSRLDSHFIQKILLNYGEKRSLSTVGIEKRIQGLSIQIATILPGDVGGTLPAMILMGFYLDDNFFKELQSVIDGEFLIFSKKEIYASTLENKDSLISVIRSLSDKDWDLLQNKEKVFPELFLKNSTYVGTFAKLKPDVGDLYLAILLSKEKVIQLQNRTQNYIMLLGFFALLLAIALSYIFSQKLIAPLKHLRDVIDRIAKGESETRVEIDSKDEIGFLAYTFNAMMAQLKEAQSKLVRTERLAAIGQLASGVGHELRNPLAAIKNAIYYIRSVIKKNPLQQENEQVQKMMDIADNEINATVKISNDLLEFSRVMRMNPTSIPIQTILDSVFTVVSIPAHVNLKTKFAQNLPAVFVDQERMRQVFINLINNAVEAMPNGGALEIETSLEGDQEVCVFVRDTGMGIKEEDQKRIFEPLFSTKVKGTGLGLAIVHGIVEAHKASISLKSVLGKGTEFKVKIVQHL
ncbi:MAG: hypothetical protein A3I11_09310 [Elusimicrobia bacterium RIFCSPLOWO2_02_FULL_39_32]|nr:MAG: hypothetical protein A3B80_07460 [Elusimicrobia bacterium RIFCSPHIGHO2_02_FULL_39_36]OGR91854.1 MAG: hypothetical protein A3I11_09310 [Elusimicrobia bacterium RIFCSPLOWO2_02_FULL_39_32]OGR99072.1 MAG: hypothetical protein A3G85_08900 [Elusimicrobia bacterium RIFCSPLOWO2_12_FULL_39_28]